MVDLILFRSICVVLVFLSSLCHAVKIPFRRGRQERQDVSPQPSSSTTSSGTPDSHASSLDSLVNNPAILDPLSKETQELLRDIEEAIEKATKQSETWIRGISFPPIVKSLYKQLMAIVLYKPPVGIVTLYTTMRLIASGRLFRLYGHSNDPKSSVEAAVAKQLGRASDEGRRAFLLDPDDVDYQNHGGVDRIRQQICAASLKSVSKPSSPWALELQTVLQQAIQVNSRSSRLAFLQDVSPLMARMETLLDMWSSSRYESNEEQIWLLAVHAIRVRVTDALLRLIRDRLLLTTHRLGRTVAYWQRRVQQPRSSWLRLPWRLTRHLEQDRLRLAYATAAYHHERTQLGRVVKLLLDRPTDIPSDRLLKAFKESKDLANTDKSEDIQSAPSSAPSSNTTEAKHWFQPRGGAIKLKWNFSPSKYYLRWRPEGQKFFSLRHIEPVQDLDPAVAATILLEYERDQDNPFVWRAKSWETAARQTICDTIRESLEGSPSKSKYNLSVEDFEKVTKSWCTGKSSKEEEWTRLILYANNLAGWRRTGEGETVRLRDAALISWTRRLDLFGVPSTLLKIKIAEWINAFFAPRWPEIKVQLIVAFSKVLEILQQRVWIPFKGIYEEIMNRSKGMMSGFGLHMEEQSLDHLLRDMGFGDGTAATRRTALQQAAAQYENDLKSGILINMVRGRLVRLLLIQVQQLKVGMLSALDTIDALMKGNQIHFQLLAAIPAVLIASFGTRLFVRFLYSIRSKDLRPIAVAHADMASYLAQIEHAILLNGDDTGNKNSDTTNSFRDSTTSDELYGEISLYMHRYLTLLDFSSPLFPASTIDQIQLSLQGLLGTTLRHGASSELTLRWLGRIQGQHQGLLKHM